MIFSTDFEWNHDAFNPNNKQQFPNKRIIFNGRKTSTPSTHQPHPHHHHHCMCACWVARPQACVCVCVLNDGMDYWDRVTAATPTRHSIHIYPAARTFASLAKNTDKRQRLIKVGSIASTKPHRGSLWSHTSPTYIPPCIVYRYKYYFCMAAVSFQPLK